MPMICFGEHREDSMFNHVYAGRYVGNLGWSVISVFENTPIPNSYFNFELESFEEYHNLELGKLYILFPTGYSYGIAQGRLLTEEEMNTEEAKNIIFNLLKYEEKNKKAKTI